MAEEKKLAIEVSSVNVKRIDMKAYGVEKPRCQVLIKVGDIEKRTSVQPGLDPVYEENFEFPVADENETKCSAIFYMDEPGQQKQIGDEQTYLLNLLKKGKPTYKGLIVPGGKVDMLFTAYGFGKEEVEEDDDGAFDMMGDDEGGMMMMDDDEDEEDEE